MTRTFLIGASFLFVFHSLAWAGGDAPPPQSTPVDPPVSDQHPSMDGGDKTSNLSCRAGYVKATKWKHGATVVVCIKK
jgi:hypothetical protein